MGKRYNGEIIYVRKNYGLISTKVEDHNVRIFFLVKPEMLDNDSFILGKNINFLTRNLQIRGTNVVTAYDLKPDIVNPTKLKIENCENISDYYSQSYISLFKSEYPIDEETNNKLLEKEKMVADFFMRWILFLEKEIKEFLIFILDKQSISSLDFIDILKSENETKKIVCDALKKLQDNSIFRPESDSFLYSINEHDPNDVIIKDAPIMMILEQLTLNELAIVFNSCKKNYCKNINSDMKILFYYTTDMLSDVIFIRNKVAHGKAVIPLIIDDTFSPSYFFEMASVFPSWNSNDNFNNAENYSAFSFIRYITKSMAKEGISLTEISGGPMEQALFFTKSLFINQAKRSLFSLIFLLMCVFSYFDSSKYNEFMDDLISVGIVGFKKTPPSIYSEFPNKENSIECRLTRILMPIFKYSGSINNFKMFSSIIPNIDN